MADEPKEAPPSYENATGKSKAETRNGIPPDHRRSMEDEHRPLPKGWVRQFDTAHNHQFFVDTTADPPRSMWHHPYDDDEYLKSLPKEERENINRLQKSISLKDIEAESSDEEGHAGPSRTAGAPEISGSSGQPTGIHKFGRRLKDKVTQTTHEERETSRRQRAELERQQYEQHLAYRRALSQAIQSGQPQYLGKDRNGRDVYIEPPSGPGAPRGAYGYNPYTQGPYANNPNARFIRPQYDYNRPVGYGYGGGLGLPLVGGLLGGALLGAALF
ncbi:hypothetical protein NA57DRAFT_54571 [Rhizodiscina lignyota]|uniref:WW domain-containing protein n=1 Tax=Rhizodiscina lignyota TaxID=1504668 RepID=A0A9P4IL71_9PEZI|nr:hypothetical protein NA57DRAFT_54571 [Rhizodiscina lignyota]